MRWVIKITPPPLTVTLILTWWAPPIRLLDLRFLPSACRFATLHLCYLLPLPCAMLFKSSLCCCYSPIIWLLRLRCDMPCPLQSSIEILFYQADINCKPKITVVKGWAKSYTVVSQRYLRLRQTKDSFCCNARHLPHLTVQLADFSHKAAAPRVTLCGRAKEMASHIPQMTRV